MSIDYNNKVFYIYDIVSGVIEHVIKTNKEGNGYLENQSIQTARTG